MGRYRISYQKRLLAYLLLGGLFPLLLASAMILCVTDRIYENTWAKSESSEVQRISREIDRLVVDYQHRMNPLLAREEIIAFLRGAHVDEKHIYGELDAILAESSGGTQIYLLSADGSRVAATDDLPQFYRLPENLHGTLFTRAAQAQDWVISTADCYEVGSRAPVFSIARAIRHGDELLGFAVVDVRREALMPLLRCVQDGGEGQLILTDSHDDVMMDMGDPYGKDAAHVLSASEEGARESVFRDASYSSQDTGFTVHLRRYMDAAPLDDLFCLVLVVDAVALSITAYLAYRLSRHLWRPLHTLATAMRRVRSHDDFSIQVDVQRSDEIGELALTFNSLIAHIRTLLAENRERERTLRVAQVKSLTEMIKPHFMYNTLNLIKWSAKLGDSEGAADIAVQLGKLLRASASMKDFVTVAEELSFLRTYLKIQQRRFDGRLKVTVRVTSSIYGCYVPKLILQPLVENAIQHGIEMTESSGRITITGQREDGYLVFRVKDNGQGMSEARRREVLARQDGNHFGLYNVHMRAVLNGDERCGIALDSTEGKGTEAILTLKHREEAPHYDESACD